MKQLRHRDSNFGGPTDARMRALSPPLLPSREPLASETARYATRISQFKATYRREY